MRRKEKVMVALLLTFNIGHIERKLKTGHSGKRPVSVADVFKNPVKCIRFS